MKNPVTFSISEARKVQKKRQTRQIIALVSVIFVLGLSILIYRVATTKEAIDNSFSSTSVSISGEALPSEGSLPQVLAETSVAASSPPPETIETTLPSSETTSSEGKPSSDSGTDVTSTTESISLEPVAITESDVFIPERSDLQTLTYQQRDAAYSSLQKSIKNYIDSYVNADTKVRIGFYYQNLEQDESFGYNVSQPFVPGGAISLPINLFLYQKVLAGEVDLNKVVTLEAADIVPNSGELAARPLGSQHFIRELAYLSLAKGDTTATNMLLRELGGIDLINEYLLSISQVVNLRDPAVLYKDYNGVQQKGKNRTSVQDMSKFALKFYHSYLAKPSIFQPMFNDLAQANQKEGTASDLPENVMVVHKIGQNQLMGSQMDIALVFSEEPYLLCVTTECADPNLAKEIQKELGKRVYDYIHNCYIPH